MRREALQASLVVIGLLGAGCASNAGESASDGFSAALIGEVRAAPGVEERGGAWRLAPLPAPPLRDLPYAVILDPERSIVGSQSIGNTSNGFLAGAHELPVETDTMYVLASHVGRRAHYATDEMANILERTGERLAARFPGTRIAMGDASRREGGDIPHHSSHNSGRDIDIPFLCQSTTSESVPTTGFTRFGRSLQSGRLVFDVERNWAFLRYFLEEAEGTVQWALIAMWLRRALLDHAIATGEPKALIVQAAGVMWQPQDSSPHDDHFHLRLFCSREDRLEGCDDNAPIWPWAQRFESVHAARVGELTRALYDDDVERRLAAVDFLVRIDGREGGPRLAVTLPEQPADVQVAILRALSEFRTPGVGRTIVGLARYSADERVREAALATLTTYAAPDAAEGLAALVEEAGQERLASGPLVRREAARALLEIQEPALVPALIRSLDDPDPETRAHLALVLRRTTGRVDGIEWQGAAAAIRAHGISDWQAWYEAHRDAEWLSWLQAGFGQRGYDLPATLASREALEVLIRAMSETEPIGYLANRLLREVTGESGPPLRWQPARQREYWHNVVRRFQ